MFDFQKLKVSRNLKRSIYSYYNLSQITSFIDILMINKARKFFNNICINEGSSRFSSKDRRHFMVISRGSAFECVAIFDFLKDSGMVSESSYTDFTNKYEEISKMLFALIRNLEK